MCLSKSSVGFRAVSKVTSTNCWHSWIESTTKAQRNLHCLVRQNTPHIPAERKDTKWLFAIFDDLKSKQDLWIFSSWVLQFQVQPGYKPNSYSICLEALASPLKTGPEFMNSSPGSWWITCFSQDYWNVGGEKKTQASPSDIWGGKTKDTSWTWSLGSWQLWILPFCMQIKRQMYSSNQSSMNKLYKPPKMPKD